MRRGRRRTPRAPPPCRCVPAMFAQWERVAGAVDSQSLAVPHTEHAIEFLAGERVQFLRAQDLGGGEVFVDARLELDVVRRHEVLLGPSSRSRPPSGEPRGHRNRGVRVSFPIQAPLSSSSATACGCRSLQHGLVRSAKRDASVTALRSRTMSMAPLPFFAITLPVSPGHLGTSTSMQWRFPVVFTPQSSDGVRQKL